MDLRLRQLYQALDANDVLVVMSDHGIRSALEHDPALFIAAASGLSSQRVPGEPELRGVPRLLADLLGVQTEWPKSGIEAWVPGWRAQGGATTPPP